MDTFQIIYKLANCETFHMLRLYPYQSVHFRQNFIHTSLRKSRIILKELRSCFLAEQFCIFQITLNFNILCFTNYTYFIDKDRIIRPSAIILKIPISTPNFYFIFPDSVFDLYLHTRVFKFKSFHIRLLVHFSQPKLPFERICKTRFVTPYVYPLISTKLEMQINSFIVFFSKIFILPDIYKVRD